MTKLSEPIYFGPIYKETIWGGTSLASRFNRPLDTNRTIGESWEIVSHHNDQSLVSCGTFLGTPLNHLVNLGREALLGNIGSFGKFPLLYKFIDACDKLSVQVHPDDEQAREHGWGEFGKTECWYVADAKKDAQIIVGFNRNVTPEVISQAIDTATLHELLNFIPVTPGDLLFIPAGTVHAIMDGTLIYEVQETSDTTLRLYDWGRLDTSGKPRQLHIRDALPIIDTQAHDHYKISPVIFDEPGFTHSYRVACRYFALEQYLFSRDIEVILQAKRSFRVVSVMSGEVKLLYPGGEARVPAGCTVLLPAIMQNVRACGSARATMIVSSVPDILNEIVEPLRFQGIPDESIENLGGFAERNDLRSFLDR